MGTAYRRNYKNFSGKDDITGHDVIAVGSGLGVSPIAQTTIGDSFGCNVFTMPRPARLEGLVANVSGPVLTGADKVGLELWAGGAMRASGSMVAGQSHVDLPLKKENLQDVVLASGDAVYVNVATDFGLTSSGTALSVRVHLAMLE